MPSRDFSGDELEDLELYEGSDNVKIYRSMGSGRWSEHFEIVFTADDGKDYVIGKQVGLTEYQDYSGSDRYPDSRRDGDRWWVSCPEVEMYQVMKPVTKWRKV